MIRFLYILFALAIFTAQSSAQVFTNKAVGKNKNDFVDSLKNSEYPYVLPILGAKATKAGFDLPYSAGISVQYFGQESDLIIDNLLVGFNGGTEYSLDGLVRFNKAQSRAGSMTVRPDIWLLPFLNVYGIFGAGTASTDVGYGLWVPDSTFVDREIISGGSKVDFNTTSMGFGFIPTIGVGGGWLALDMNLVWTDIPQLEKPARTFVLGPRLGKTIELGRPDRNINLWVGGFRVALNSNTSGSINTNEVLPVSEWEQKIENGIEIVDNSQQQVDSWWDNLNALEKLDPSNVAKRTAANLALSKAGEVLTAAESALGAVDNSTIQYSIEKRPAAKWNFIVGSQFQLNKHFMIRAEYGFLASRTQFTTGLQYRFGL